MTRIELEHIIRAAGAIADVTEIIILGSQSVHLGLLSKSTLLERLRETELSDAQRNAIEAHIERGFPS